jgi:hypothetical protein
MKKPTKWMFPAKDGSFSAKRLRKIIKRLRAWYVKEVEAGRQDNVPSAADLQKQAEKFL